MADKLPGKADPSWGWESEIRKGKAAIGMRPNFLDETNAITVTHAATVTASLAKRKIRRTQIAATRCEVKTCSYSQKLAANEQQTHTALTSPR
jgi:hypothetical protein